MGIALLILLLVSGAASAGLTSPPSPHRALFGPGPPAHPSATVLPAAAPRSWINATSDVGPSPPLLLWANLVWDPIDGYLVLFGGCTVTVCPMPAQTWTFFNGTWHNITDAGAQPPARSYAMMAFDGSDGYLVLYGGVGSTVLNDTWTFLGGQWVKWSMSVGTVPPGRWGGSLVYDRSDGELVLFGGMSGSGTLLSDTWSFAGGAWTDLTGTARGPPPPRYETAMAWDDSDQEVVLTDGYDAAGAFLNDTWTFSNGRWQDATGGAGTLPPARALSSLTFDGSAGFLLEFGGYGTAGALNDTWTFQNNRWSNLGASLAIAPPPRGSAAATEDTIGWTSSMRVTVPFVLLFGGDFVPCPGCGTQGRQDTWVFESPPTAAASASPSAVEAGQPLTLAGTASGGTPPYTFRWSLPNGSARLGALVQISFPSAGSPSVILTAADAAGAPAFAAVVVTVVTGPTVSATADPTVTDVGVPVRFTATGSGGIAPYSLSWAFGDGGTSALDATSHAFLSAGPYPVLATVTDAAQGVGSAEARVLVNPVPTAEIVASTLAPLGPAPVNFTASIVGGTAPFRVLWEFGDGATATTSNATWAYASPGRYLVTLNITDAVNVSAQQAAIVEVAPLQPAPTPLTTESPPWLGIGMLAAAVAIVAVGIILALRRGRRPRAPLGPPAKPPAAPAWDEGPGTAVTPP